VAIYLSISNYKLMIIPFDLYKKTEHCLVRRQFLRDTSMFGIIDNIFKKYFLIKNIFLKFFILFLILSYQNNLKNLNK
jgi:hypothetical protein